MPETTSVKKIDFMKRLILFCWLIIFCANLLAREDSSKINSPDFQKIIETESSAKEMGRKWDEESIKHSIALYLYVSDQWKEIGEFEKSADCLREISNFYIILGKNDRAGSLLNQVIHIDDRYNNPNKDVKTLSLLAIVTLHLGKIDEALKFSGKAIQISQPTDNADSLATALYTQALVDYEDGKFSQATENFERALSWWKKDGDFEGQAKALLELAYAYMTNDELLVGLQKAEESLRISNEINNLQYRTLAQNATGVLKSKLGKKQEALNIFLKSEKEFPDGVNSLEKGDMYNHLAGIYYDLSDLQLALKYRKKALEIFQKVKNPFAQLATLSKLGIITFQLGDEAKGLEYFDRGFDLANQINSGYYRSVFAQDLGNLYFERDKQKALTYFRTALPRFEKLRIRTHIAIIQSQIGAIYQSRGMLNLAKQYFDSSLKLNRETKNKFAEAQNLYYLASNYKIENDEWTALKLTKRSLEIVENLNSDIANSDLKRTYFSNVYDRYELYINLLMQRYKPSQNGDFAIQALQASEKARSRSLLENLHLSKTNFTRDASPESVEKEEELLTLLNMKTSKLTELLSGDAGKAEIESIEGEIRNSQQELEEIRAELKQKSPIYSAIKDPPLFNVGEFQSKVLDENSVLLEFSLGKEESYLWVVGKTEFNSYVLPPRDQIESRIERLRALLDQNVKRPDEKVNDFQTRVAEAEAEYLREARALSIDLLGQAADKLAGKRLIVVADGKIHYFPLAALPFPNSTTDDPILLTNEVVYEPSAAALMLIKNNASTRTLPQKDLFLVSDPVFSKADERLLENGGSNSGFVTTVLGSFRSFDSLDSLPRLPASMDEANSITQVVSSSVTTARSGFAANRENVLNAGIADYKVVHFATHGLLDEKRPELSGIVLSLFDEAGKVQDGGFIRLQDVYGMNLNADLVVLSACDTGLGKEIKGEGLMSLNNAFLQAGAKSVVSSLWRVEDTATKQLMTDFYRGMAADGLTSSEALRQAQINLYKDPRFASPFYWASFTAQGNFSTAPQFSSRSYVWIYILGLVLISLGGLYLLRRAHNRNHSQAA